MIETFIKKTHRNISGNRPIPNWLLFISALAVIIPILLEQLSPNYFNWLWFLYIIPASVAAYYLDTKLKVFIVMILTQVILFVEYYHHLLLKHGVVEQELRTAMGVILSLIITSIIVSKIAKKIRVARKNWEIICENTDVGIEIVDKYGFVVYVNSAFKKLRETRKKDVITALCSDTNYQKCLKNSLESGKGFIGKEYIETCISGNERVLRGDSFVFRDKHDNVIGAILTIRDITERKIIEGKVRQSEKFKVLGQMAAGLAHEIRNPLTSIRGFLQLNYLKETESSNKEFIEIMLEEIDRVNKLLSEFLVLAKQVPPKRELYNVKELIDKVLALISPEAELKQLKVDLKVTGLIPLIFIDSEQFKQVILNITQNAIEAMTNGGILQIELSTDGGQVKILISDTGEGIDSRVLNKIFQPFYTTKETGTGLGLALCQRIIENHSGKLEIASETGVGTRVTIALPSLNIV